MKSRKAQAHKRQQSETRYEMGRGHRRHPYERLSCTAICSMESEVWIALEFIS
jgi:hypothetical protein